MLRVDLPFQPRGWLLKAVAALLSEAFLGFLAIVSVALTLIPMLFAVQAHTGAVIETGQWLIIALFGVDYGLGLTWTSDRRAYLRNGWRLLDLLTIVVPLITLLPQVSPMLRSSPVLRLIRLLRVVTLGVRASGVIVREETRRAVASAAGPAEVSVLRAGKSPEVHPASWDELLRWARSPGEEWYHVSNLSPAQLRQVALALDLKPAYLESQVAAGYPHLEVTSRYATLFVWLPELQSAGTIQRNGLLLLATKQSVFTLAGQPTGLLQAVAGALPDSTAGAPPFSARMTRAFLQAVLNRNEELVGRFEQGLRALEEVPVRESRAQFFEQSFRLKKELAAAQFDLWRLKGILTALTEARVKLPGGVGAAESFHSLAESADFLYETVVNTREGLLSVIDLHLNVVSFEMNRVMRVLAVVSVLGLIPAVIGGLFGMNLAGNPWPFTLPQVAFGVSLAMALCLYLFLVKGWLR